MRASFKLDFSRMYFYTNEGEYMQAYLDCRAGISGDMTLAALCHLGLDLKPLEVLLADAGIECTLRQWQECRHAGPGHRVEVHWPAEQPLRHPADMLAIFERVKVSDRVRQKAVAALDALTRAEAHAHQIAPEEVHFHEVGAIDTLVDILGAAWGLEELGVTRVTASPLPWFTGTVHCAHGELPLPAPATAWLMQGKPVFDSGQVGELITPTGAALVHALAEEFTEGPAGVLHRLGTGYGSRPSNSGLRLWLVQSADQHQYTPPTLAEGPRREDVVLLESHLDHLTGEELGVALEELAALPEVLDVLWLPGVGKKNRPAGALRVLCLPQDKALAEGAFLRHTHSLGLRSQTVQRLVLPRESCEADSGLGPLAAKRYVLEGVEYVRVESDALREMAAQEGVAALALGRGR